MSLETVLAYEAGVKDGLAQARKRDTMLDDMCNLIDERDILLAEKALLESERDALKSQNALLVEALTPWLEHKPSCYFANQHYTAHGFNNGATTQTCTCGLNEALAAVKETK